MGDDELLDDEEQEEEVMAGAVTGRSKIVTILLWVAGGIASLLLMVLISYLVAGRVKQEAYRETQDIVIAPAPPPLAAFPFKKEFRVNTADTDEPHFIQVAIAFG